MLAESGDIGTDCSILEFKGIQPFILEKLEWLLMGSDF
jgi:hypothetical protein